MKHIAALLISMACADLAFAQTNVGVSVSVAQPGVYGRIDIGNVPPPVVYAQPILVVPQPVVVHQQPLYLYVPPGHQKHWSKHCARYDACGQPVYFVKEGWVKQRYAEEHGKGHKKEKKHKD